MMTTNGQVFIPLCFGASAVSMLVLTVLWFHKEEKNITLSVFLLGLNCLFYIALFILTLLGFIYK
jgi:hypothetical protein